MSGQLTQYRVAKFGGTSVKDHSAIEHVAAIVQSNPKALVVVLSAMAKVTDLLLGAAQSATRGDSFASEQATFRQSHKAAAKALIKSPHRRRKIDELIDAAADEFGAICHSLATLREHTPRILDMTAARGERVLAQIFCELMVDRGVDAIYIDATRLIKVERQYGSPFPDLEATARNVDELIVPCLERGQLVVVPGFIGTGSDGELVTLGRGGSDLSATVLGHCLKAQIVTLYKEVEGLLTADPRHVKEARIVPELHYREAAELAYYGAKVLHPRTIIPLLKHQIPLSVRSTFNPGQTGTRIAGDVPPGAFPVKALTAILEQSLIAIEGKGMMGVPGIAARTFSALAQAGISVSVISQASSEASICFIVPSVEAKAAVRSLRESFSYEIEHNLIDDVRATANQAVLAIVGLGMQGTPGIAARVFTALARADANVEAIAQGSSELNISVVIGEDRVPAALASLHREFRLEKLRAMPPQADGDVHLAIFGVGQIGRTLLRQVTAQEPYFREKMQLNLNCIGLIDTSGVLAREGGFTRREVEDLLILKDRGIRIRGDAQKKRLSQTELAAELQSKFWQLPVKKGVFVDLTADESAPIILDALHAGWHVALANKKPLAVKQQQFDELFSVAAAKGVQLRYEATVGAGLPVLDTITKLKEAGDEIRTILGCFSGTLGYLMTEMEHGASFSDAVRRAHSLGYTEPDPREDLSGMDVARKSLILARTLGMRLDLSDIRVEPLFPTELSHADPQQFLNNLRTLDHEWEARLSHAKTQQKTIRFVARIGHEQVTVGCEVVDIASPLGRLQGTDNQVAITTRRYAQNPLIVSGPGAGAEVTAAGVLNDVLAIALSLDMETRIPSQRK